MVPRAGRGISRKRKICFLCWDLKTVLPSPWSCAGSSPVPLVDGSSYIFRLKKYIENFSSLNLKGN